MPIKTADLCDHHSQYLRIAEPLLGDFGGQLAFGGAISTVKCFEDNSLVRAALETNGHGRILVIDGGGSLRCALVGDQLAQLAADNNWAGLIVNGCIRDAAAIAGIDIGCKALATHPLKSVKQGIGASDVPVHFADIDFTPGHHVYADEDGVIIAAKPLPIE